MTALGLLSLKDIFPLGWLVAAYFAVIAGLPLVILFLLMLKVRGRRKTRIEHAPVAAAAIPRDLAREAQPWIGRLAHLGLPVLQVVRAEGEGDPDEVTWHLAGSKDRTVGVFTGTLPAGGGRPAFALTLYAFLSDGRVIVTADRMITHRPPPHWSLVQRRYRTLEGQVEDHRARIAAGTGDATPMLPWGGQAGGLLAAEEQAVREALAACGDYADAGDGVLRPAFLRLPKLACLELANIVSGIAFPPARRRDVASVRRENTPGEEEIEPAGGAFKLTLEQTVEQDVRRYRKHADGKPGMKPLLLKIAVLAATLILFTASFGRETPLATAGMLLGLIAFHEAGHWLAMTLFGYRGMGRFFVPFFGAADRGKKLNATPWQQLFVILAGPVPGLLAGMAVLVAGFFLPSLPLWLLDLGGLAVVLNAFHLLPFLPLDGGKVVDLLVFRDLPLLRPVFTAISAILTLLASFVVNSRAIRFLAIGMFAGLIWDIKMIKVVRGGRKLGWAGSVEDEDEALRKIFRGVREEENEAFLRSHDWQRQIDVLLSEVLRKRPGFATRIFGGGLYWTTAMLPILLMVGVIALMVLGGIGSLGRLAVESAVFAADFPAEKRAIAPERLADFRMVTAATHESAWEDLPPEAPPAPDERRVLAAKATPVLLPMLDQLDWTSTGIAHHCGELVTPVLSVWLEILSAKMEGATREGRTDEATRRAEVLLHAAGAMEPALTLADRELLRDAELRALSAVEKLAAGGKLDAATLQRLEARVNGLNKAAVPEVENLLLVGGWGARQAENLARFDAGDAAEMPDARFWRQAYPQVRRFSKDVLGTLNGTPAVVATARHWTKTRRVGELPREPEETVALGDGEAEFIRDFCESHRRISWRRITTLSALRLEAYRQKSGSLPGYWKHAVPGGASLTLVHENGPYLELADRRDQMQEVWPKWLGEPAKEAAPLDHHCPLFGAPLELSGK